MSASALRIRFASVGQHSLVIRNTMRLPSGRGGGGVKGGAITWALVAQWLEQQAWESWEGMTISAGTLLETMR